MHQAGINISQIAYAEESNDVWESHIELRPQQGDSIHLPHHFLKASALNPDQLEKMFAQGSSQASQYRCAPQKTAGVRVMVGVQPIPTSYLQSKYAPVRGAYHVAKRKHAQNLREDEAMVRLERPGQYRVLLPAVYHKLTQYDHDAHNATNNSQEP
eukprot:CAMPEP_0178393134 /NCGR_PEP_ID=MMETSP0689_2-20121128/12032_1 /TAXON_ID=160604 /ORGANISM="Amphidinium massartii, Strain CS-259" /LENGTH=155 /DNA_ID=CAMNT_0020013719 /DNA_START=223 /DNA_END=690 /DNA_ORIENTATION=+